MEVSPLRALTLEELKVVLVLSDCRNESKPVEGIDTLLARISVIA